MRYVKRATDYDEQTLHLAEELFERFVGRRLSTDMYEETVSIVNHRGHLTHTPVVEVLSVRARCEGSAYVPWALDADISPEDVGERGGNIVLPSTLFGEAYTSAKVTYLSGLDDVPVEIEDCVLEIASAIRQRMMDEWSGPSGLSDEAQATINKFKNERR